MEQIVLKESYGSTPNKKIYVRSQTDELRVVVKSECLTSGSQFFREVFLPKGYPESVSSDYLVYQVWDTVQAFASSITGTLATQAVLKGVGVGDQSATVMAATMTWLMKDGTGMLGRILFAWMQGTYLDCDCKKWRLFADILNDISIFLDICAPMLDGYFTLVVCTAGVFRSIVGVAGGATRAALTQHQSRRNNMADVSAKDGSQETMVNLAALLCSLALIPVVTGRQWLIWLLFIFFTFLHIFANYSAVSSLAMETFNQSRLHIVVKDFLDSNCFQVTRVKPANLKEPVFWKEKRKLALHLGISFWKAVQSYGLFTQLQSIYKDENYILNISLKSGATGIILSENAGTSDMIKSCFQAEVIEYCLNNMHNTQYTHNVLLQAPLETVIEAAKQGDELSLLTQSHHFTAAMFPQFMSQCQSAGWDITQSLLCAEEWRAQWGQPEAKVASKKAF